MFNVFSNIRNLYLASIILLSVLPRAVEAEFNMNFTPVDPTFGDHGLIDVRCHRPEGPNVGCSGSWSNIGDPTPFLQELVTIDNEDYYHIIVGLPEDGFSQETFIKTSGRYEGGPSSASLGDGLCRFDTYKFSLDECNAGDPLGKTHTNNITGNGSGDPRVVTIRQLMGGTWDSEQKTWSCNTGDTFCYEFTKNDYLLKPKIEMIVKDSNQKMEAKFNLDMSNSDYTTDSVAGLLSNTVVFSDAEISDVADFNSAQNSATDSPHITGGRYTFIGTGPTHAKEEPYNYIEDDFELDQDWWEYKE